MTPALKVPVEDLAVPKAAPKEVKTMAATHPRAEKKGWTAVSKMMRRPMREGMKTYGVDRATKANG